MSRKGSPAKREVLPDPVFNKIMVSKLVNYIMCKGKKSVAEKIVYGAFDVIKEKIKADPIEVFDQAMVNVRPSVEVRSRRIGGATYQVPMEVRDVRSVALALRWIVNSSQGRSEQSMKEKLAAEIMDAYNERGGAISIKENKRKMAEANKAFAHYRW
jgi:small subunit ribosomal protein S7